MKMLEGLSETLHGGCFLPPLPTPSSLPGLLFQLPTWQNLTRPPMRYSQEVPPLASLCRGSGVFFPFLACVSPDPFVCRNLSQTLRCTPVASPHLLAFPCPAFPQLQTPALEGLKGACQAHFCCEFAPATPSPRRRRGLLLLIEGGVSHSRGTGVDKARSAAWEPHLPGVWGASRLSCGQGWPCWGLWAWAL